MRMNPREWNLPTWLMVLAVGATIGAGIWAFGAGKPPRVSQIEIGLRQTGDQQAEFAIRETDHLGEVHVYDVGGPQFDLSLINRPRSIFTDPVVLSDDTRNAPSQVRITMRGLSDEDVKLGLRKLRPNRQWDSSRFPRPQPIRMEELSTEEWFWLTPQSIRVTYHQGLVSTVQLFVYVAGTFALLIGICWFVWRRWLN